MEALETRKYTTYRTGGGNDAGAHLKEQGNPEVPNGTDDGTESSLGIGESSGRDRQQGAPLRPADGVNKSVLCPTDSPNSSKIPPLHEGLLKEI